MERIYSVGVYMIIIKWVIKLTEGMLGSTVEIFSLFSVTLGAES